MIKGFLLIKLVPGLEADTLAAIGQTHGVVDINLVFGQWDAVAIAEAKNLHDLARIVVGQVRGIQGVQETSTLVQGEV